MSRDFSFVGAWMRSRSGPTRDGGVESIATWHLVGSVINGWGVEHACSSRSRNPYPQGGHRWEVSFLPWGLSGDICQRCARQAGWSMTPSGAHSHVYSGCHKCGGGYIIQPIYDPSCAIRDSEHLHWACPGCGFNWTTNTADAS